MFINIGSAQFITYGLEVPSLIISGLFSLHKLELFHVHLEKLPSLLSHFSTLLMLKIQLTQQYLNDSNNNYTLCPVFKPLFPTLKLIFPFSPSLPATFPSTDKLSRQGLLLESTGFVIYV